MFLSAAHICLLFMSQVRTIKLTESINICYISDKVAFTIKDNVEKVFIGKNGFLYMFMWGRASVRE